MAKYFESLVRNDPFFEIPAKRHLGLVVFRLKVMPSLAAVNAVIGRSFMVSGLWDACRGCDTAFTSLYPSNRVLIVSQKVC